VGASHIRTIAAIVLAGALLSACAKAGGQATQGRTLVLHLDDAGKVTVLHHGDRLVLDLGKGQISAFLQFRLAGYPEGQVRLVSADAPRGRFEFQAGSSGSGDVRVEATFKCGGRLPVGAPSFRCPVAGDEVPYVNRSYRFPVRVT
jgi:hypothetical protein